MSKTGQGTCNVYWHRDLWIEAWIHTHIDQKCKIPTSKKTDFNHLQNEMDFLKFKNQPAVQIGLKVDETSPTSELYLALYSEIYKNCL